MRRVFISYAREDQVFAERLAQALIKAEFEVRFDQTLHPPTEWEPKLSEMVVWADCCIFVVSTAFNNSPFINREEKVWVKPVAVLPDRLYKFFVVKLEPGCVVDDYMKRFQAADFIGWEDEANFRRGWTQLTHHLHHHQFYPDLFVNREDESRLCAKVLDRPAEPGVLICNREGRREIGNSMLLWHLEETYLHQFLTPPYFIVPLDWRRIIQGLGPVEFLNYTADLMRHLMRFDIYDAMMREKLAAGRAAKQKTKGTKSARKPTIRSAPGMTGFALEDQGRLVQDGEEDVFGYLTYLNEEMILRDLTGAFLQDIKRNATAKLIWLVNGPHEAHWVLSLGQRHGWLKDLFFELSRVPNAWMFAAGTHPMLSPTERYNVQLVVVDYFRPEHVAEYVTKRLHGISEPHLTAMLGQSIWDKTKGHPGEMYREVEALIQKLPKRT